MLNVVIMVNKILSLTKYIVQVKMEHEIGNYTRYIFPANRYKRLMLDKNVNVATHVNENSIGDMDGYII